MAKPREIEVKLDIEPNEAGSIPTGLELLGAKEQGSDRLVSTYFDTADQDLRAGGLSLRIRKAGTQKIQTVKSSAGVGAGLFDRGEWETEVTGNAPDLAALAETPLKDVIANLDAPLVPVFTSEVERRVWLVSSDKAEIEVALDIGRVASDRSEEPLAELEFELKRGEPEALFDVVKKLSELTVLRVGVLTKSERGYRVLDGKGRKAIKAEPVMLEAGINTAKAFQAILRACIRHFRLNEPLVIETRKAEPLHQMRVAMRRLRSAMSLFKPVVADATYEELTNRLREASREFGDARNLDVYLETIARREGESYPDEPGSADYVREIERRRELAFDRVVETLRSKPFQQLMLDLFQWVETGPWLTDDEPERRRSRKQPIEAFAAACLDSYRRKIKKQGRDLESLDPHERHRVRIKAKKLRYAAEFFASLVHGKKQSFRHTAFVEALSDLQDHLGELNDIQTAHTIVDDLAGAHDPARPSAEAGLLAAGHATGLQDARIEGLLEKAHKAHHTFADARPFWRAWRVAE